MATPQPIGPLLPPPAFLAAATELGVEFEPGDLEQLGRYLALLLETNRQFNLTAITDPDEAWMRHILDSLTLLQVLAELPPGARIVDVGSGGGLPGMVLAIVMPHLRFTLLEATGKKADFLRSAAAALGLANIDVVQQRAEKAGHDPHHREQYDAAIARAVGPLAVIAELTIPLVKIESAAYLIKGQRADEELAAARQALYLLHAAHAGTLETPTNRIVVLTKSRKTPRAYPRREGDPKRAPLGC
jgi:16S rRNA (guanine527-N7)-methyltransferase